MLLRARGGSSDNVMRWRRSGGAGKSPLFQMPTNRPPAVDVSALFAAVSEGVFGCNVRVEHSVKNVKGTKGRFRVRNVV